MSLTEMGVAKIVASIGDRIVYTCFNPSKKQFRKIDLAILMSCCFEAPTRVPEVTVG